MSAIEQAIQDAAIRYTQGYITDFSAVADEVRASMAPALEWQDIATAPKGRKLIVGYANKLGNWRSVMACYYGEGQLPNADDYDDEFAPPGWYEESESQEHILPTDEEPTHWMALPTPPTTTEVKP